MLYEESGIISCLHDIISIVWYDTYDVQLELVHTSNTINNTALVPRAVCSSMRSPIQQSKNMRTVSSRRENKMYRPCRRKKKKSIVPSRRARNYIPPCPVVKNYMHRLVPLSKIYIYRPVLSWQFLFNVQSRRDNFCLPSRPVMKQKGRCTTVVSSRPVEKIHTHRPAASHPGNYNFHYFAVPSRPVFTFFPVKHVKTVPSRPVSDITSLVYFLHARYSCTRYIVIREKLLVGLHKKKRLFTTPEAANSSAWSNIFRLQRRGRAPLCT